MKQKRKNPLRRRLLRELLGELGKYLVIFLLLTGTIGFVSGFLVADGSMMIAYDEGFARYNIEDGNFRLDSRANKAQLKSIQAAGVTLYENFYVEEPLTNGSTMRIFSNRTQVNLVCLMEGAFPQAAGEIAIDRMYADNNGLQVGDLLQSAGADGRSWVITGLVALPDYSCLFSNNNDTMFDAILFGVAVVTPEEFAALGSGDLYYSYSWKYDQPPASEAEEKDLAEDLMKVINAEASLQTYIPCYLNQAIQFTGEDMGSDRAMMIALLYIVIVIMAFVFGVTITNTITREANVIGTLRASGYTRAELLRHYMAMPMAVTLAGAVTGNLLGYTVFKDIAAAMYYGSYSLPTYVTVWNAEAFLLTTLVPVALMALINFVILLRKLQLSPLKFLRRDLSRKRQRPMLPLSPVLPFFGRFRLRVIFQNMGSYAVLFVGVLFANLLLMFGLALPAVLDHYQQEVQSNLLCSYQYILQVPLNAMREDRKLESLLNMMVFQQEVETDNADAEKFSAYSLKTLGDIAKSEEVLLYGVQENSRYLPLELGGGVYISSAYAEKFLLEPSDAITLKESYEDTQYQFTVAGVYPYPGALAVFMDQQALNTLFDLGSDYYSGYFSATPITDIDSEYIASVIDLEALTKVSRQLDVSMGNMMYMVDGFSIIMFAILIYLLSKIIIEKNAQSISMVKILGYSTGEICRLYILSTSLVVVLCLLLSLPIAYGLLVWIFRIMMLESLTGWISLYVAPTLYLEMFAMGLAAYAVVALLEYRRLQRVPMDEALKNVE